VEAQIGPALLLLPQRRQQPGKHRRACHTETVGRCSLGTTLAEPRRRRLVGMAPRRRLSSSADAPPSAAAHRRSPPSSASPPSPPPCAGKLRQARAAGNAARSRRSCGDPPPREGRLPERAASPASFVDRARLPPPAPAAAAAGEERSRGAFFLGLGGLRSRLARDGPGVFEVGGVL
jgi:hypothetical protein